MKTVFATFGRRFAGLGTAALLACSAPVLNSFAQPASPVGQWDCVMSGGGQNGILFLNFCAESDTANGLPVFEGIYIQAGHQKLSTGRGGAVTTGRGSSSTFTNIFGGGFITGSANGTAVTVGPDDWYPDSRGFRGYWSYNSKGQTFGSYYMVMTSPLKFTNNVSFVGKVVPGKRLTMVGTSAFGKFTIRGVPLVPVATALPVDGFHWAGTVAQNGVKSFETFSLTALSVPNMYALTGAGPSYSYDWFAPSNNVSFCLISSQKRMAFQVEEIPIATGTNAVVTERATSGHLINSTKAIQARGSGDSSGDLNVVTFNASLVPYIIP